MKEMKGVVVGTVREVNPATAAVIVDFPWMSPAQKSHWAPIATLMSGKERGTYYMPEIGDEVLVAFEHGDFDHPFVVGFLWNGVDVPPSTDGHLRLIRSVNGHEIALYDPPVSAGNRGYIRVKDAHGNLVELTNGKVTIRGVGVITIQAPVVSINGRVVAPTGSPI